MLKASLWQQSLNELPLLLHLTNYMRTPSLFFGLLCCYILSFSACYEDRIGCLNPDATNFDERADEACPDNCCSFPTLSLDVDRFWGEETLASLDTLVDGVGNEFVLTRFRFYLTEVEVVTETGVITAVNEIETSIIEGGDTVLTTLNANLGLIESTGGTTEEIGTIQVGTEALTQVQGLFGMREDFPAVYPPEAPSGAALATQQGLLNFNDGNGYLLGSLEVLMLADSSTRRIDLTGNLPIELSFGAAVAPVRGANLTVEIAADYQSLLGSLNLLADESSLANDLRSRLNFFLTFTGLR